MNFFLTILLTVMLVLNMGKLMKKHEISHPILDELKRKPNFKLRELIEYANKLLPVFAENREHSRCKGPLSERTVRYYVKENLIDQPVCYNGCYAFFSYRHILQALVIKYLQSNERTLKEIHKIMRKLNNKDLEAVLFGKDSNRTFLNKTAIDSKTLFSPADLLQTFRPTKNNFYIPPSRLDDHSWRRFKINDRLELHIMDHPDILTSGIDIHNSVNTIVEILTKINQSGLNETRNLRNISGAQFGNQEADLDIVPSPIKNQPYKVIALVTEGGLVPLGNPDRLESAKSKRFLRYSLRGIDNLRSNAFESVSGGWDNRYINADPDRLLPLDVMREIENKAKCLKIHEYFYTTTGAAMSLEVAKKIGENIAQELKKQDVSAVIFTST